MGKINYDEISKVYDSVRQSDISMVQRIIDISGLKDDPKILEIGCGTGNFTLLMSKISGAQVFGLDQSQGMLDKAKKKCEGVHFIKGDAVTLDGLEDNMFDIVYMVDVIHHIKDIDTMFKNINRVLKYKGSLIIYTDSHEHIRNRLTTKYFPETLEVELERYQSTEELFGALEKNGFKDIKWDTLLVGEDKNYAERLMETARVKGFSMFNLISEEAIEAGIKCIKDDISSGKEIVQNSRAPYIYAQKVDKV